MAKCYIVHLAYNGGPFFGWQVQPDKPTIQGKVKEALESLFPGKARIGVFACSRTDAGVHALGQVVKIEIPRRFEPDQLKDLLNQALDPSIYCLQCQRINPSFRVTDWSIDKEYFYFLGEEESSFIAGVGASIDWRLMEQGAQSFIGKHQFRSFQNRSQVKGGFEREIHQATLLKASEIFPDYFDDDTRIFVVRGEGFLKQMVRIMVGTLINLGRGECTLEQIQGALEGEDSKLGFIAPAHGLFLHTIRYPAFPEHPEREIHDRFLYREYFPNFELWRERKAPRVLQNQSSEHQSKA